VALGDSRDCRMTYSAQQCLDKARECTLMASQAKDRDAERTFIELARQWQELASQKEDMERDRPKLP
jgi:phage anti-repressor protein